jgi:hypothetical protein
MSASTSRRSVRIHAALDLCDSFLVAMDHANNYDCAAYQNRYDRDQQAAQAGNRIDQSIHSPSPDPAGAKALVFLEH